MTSPKCSSRWGTNSRAPRRSAVPRSNRNRVFDPRPRPTGPQPLPHVGVRTLDCVRPDRVTVDTVALNPGEFGCARLMADLFDGWLAHRHPGVDSHHARHRTALGDKTALVDFGRFVDGHVEDLVALRLVSLPLAVVSAWEDDLAGRFLIGRDGEMKRSNEPHVRPAKLFSFIRAADRIGIPVEPVLLDRAGHGPRARWHRHVVSSVNGFSDDDDRVSKTSFLAVLYRSLERVRRGAVLAGQGGDPAEHGWNSLANLAWLAVHGGGFDPNDIRVNLWDQLPAGAKGDHLDPGIADLWPDGLPREARSRAGFASVLRVKVYRLVFPTADDVLAAYFLLLQLTGGEPSWAQSLTAGAMRVRGSGCVISGHKSRQVFATVKERVFPRLPGARMCVPKLWDLIVELTATVRAACAVAGDADQGQLWLHLDAGRYQLGIVREFNLRGWWERHGDGDLSGYDTRSFRQSRRSLDTIDVRGEDLTGNPFEHSLNVFLNHYSNDPKLLVLTLETLDAFQRNWFDSVVNGQPELVQRHGVVLTTALMDRLAAGDGSARALVKASTGLDDGGLDRLITTDDDDTPVGTACTDVTAAPFDDAVPGEVCQRLWVGTCFGCTNAVVTERHLPFIVHFYDTVIAEDRRDLPGDVFAQRWANAHAAIQVIFDVYGPAAVAAARADIAARDVKPFLRQVELGLGGRLW